MPAWRLKAFGFTNPYQTILEGYDPRPPNINLSSYNLYDVDTGF